MHLSAKCSIYYINQHHFPEHNMSDLNKSLFVSCIIGFFVVSVCGTLLHFLYDFSGNNLFAAVISPINESVWEHTKLLFFPMLLYGIFLSFHFHDQYAGILPAFLAGLLGGCLFIPIFYYFYTGILGFGLLPVDIALFYLAVLLAFVITYRGSIANTFLPYRILLCTLTGILLLCYVVFTFSPPKFGLFAAP